MNEELRAELLRREVLDQGVRTRVPSGQPLPPGLLEEWERVDTDNTAFLKAVIAEYGWPGRDMVGEDGAISAWLFAQHADRDPEFQRGCLPLLKAAARAGQARLQDWAYLVDRVRVAGRRPQLYGTQYTGDENGTWPQPIQDPEHLDERRAAVGLGPHADYDELMRRKPSS